MTTTIYNQLASDIESAFYNISESDTKEVEVLTDAYSFFINVRYSVSYDTCEGGDTGEVVACNEEETYEVLEAVVYDNDTDEEIELDINILENLLN